MKQSEFDALVNADIQRMIKPKIVAKRGEIIDWDTHKPVHPAVRPVHREMCGLCGGTGIGHGEGAPRCAYCCRGWILVEDQVDGTRSKL